MEHFFAPDAAFGDCRNADSVTFWGKFLSCGRGVFASGAFSARSAFCLEKFGAARENSFRSRDANLPEKFAFSLVSVRGESGTERRFLSIPRCWIFAFAVSAPYYRAWLSRL